MRGSLVLAAWLLALPLAAAHGDRDIAPSGTLADVPPGGDAVFPFQGHYHRVVGTVEPEPGSAVVVLVQRPGDATPLWSSGRIDAPRGLNALIPCCDGVTWADLRLVVRAADPGAGARATLALEAVHDDFYVAGAGKEGDIFLTPLLFGIGGVLLARGGYRAWRAPSPSLSPAPPAPALAPGARATRSALSWSAALTTAVVLAAVAAGSWGAARHGGTRIEGFLAAAGTLSPWWGSVSAFLVLLVPWTIALVLWMRAYRAATATDGARAGVAILGVAQAAAIAALPPFFGAAYGPETFATTAWCFWPMALVQLGLLAMLAARTRMR